MKAYQLKTGEWIDLEHVLGIDPPKLRTQSHSNGYEAYFNIHFMFQDTPRCISRENQTEYLWTDPDPNRGGARSIIRSLGPVKSESGEPQAVHWLRTEVFEPLLAAWKE